MNANVKLVSFSLAALLMLSACGQKGPLFLPEEEDQTGVSQTEEDEETGTTE